MSPGRGDLIGAYCNHDGRLLMSWTPSQHRQVESRYCEKMSSAGKRENPESKNRRGPYGYEEPCRQDLPATAFRWERGGRAAPLHRLRLSPPVRLPRNAISGSRQELPINYVFVTTCERVGDIHPTRARLREARARRSTTASHRMAVRTLDFLAR